MDNSIVLLPHKSFIAPEFLFPTMARSDWSRAFSETGIRQNLDRYASAVVKLKVDYTGETQIYRNDDMSKLRGGPQLQITTETAPTLSFGTSYQITQDFADDVQYKYNLNAAELSFQIANQAVNKMFSRLSLKGSGGATEGIMNAPGNVVGELLHQDTAGNTVLTAQNAAELRNAVVRKINYLLSANNIFESGSGDVTDVQVAILSSQRLIQSLATSFVSFDAGAKDTSVFSIIDGIKRAMSMIGVEVVFGVDNEHFQGKGETAGAIDSKVDKLLITITKIPSSSSQNLFSTNLVLEQNSRAERDLNLIYCSNIVPDQITYPDHGEGVITRVKVNRVSPGWSVWSGSTPGNSAVLTAKMEM